DWFRPEDRLDVHSPSSGIIHVTGWSFLALFAAKLEPWRTVLHGTVNTWALRPGISAGRSLTLCGSATRASWRARSSTSAAVRAGRGCSRRRMELKQWGWVSP